MTDEPVTFDEHGGGQDPSEVIPEDLGPPKDTDEEETEE